MKKNIQTLVSTLNDDAGKLSGGFGAIRGGRNIDLPSVSNGSGCTNSETCTSSNASECTNSGDCTQTSNITGCQNSLCIS